MVEVGRGSSARQRGDRAVELRVAARVENVAVVRTLVGAIGAFEDLDIDTVADLRLAVDELCTQLIRSARPGAFLVVVVEPRDAKVVVQAFTDCESDDALKPGSFSWHVLTSLAEEVEAFRDGHGVDEGSGVFGVALTMCRAGSDK